MRIAIVNDLAIAVAALQRVLLKVPDYQVIWVARDGAEAVAKCKQDTPDLILMDLVMPVMDGVEATRQIVQNFSCAVLIVTVSAEQNVAKVYEAMGYGALDAVDTPVLGQESAQTANQLLTKISRIRKLLKVSPTNTKPSVRSPQLERRNNLVSGTSLIAIGSSTGGPKALASILSKLPANFPAAIAIVQHVDADFSAGFVEWLNQQTAFLG